VSSDKGRFLARPRSESDAFHATHGLRSIFQSQAHFIAEPLMRHLALGPGAPKEQTSLSLRPEYSAITPFPLASDPNISFTTQMQWAHRVQSKWSREKSQPVLWRLFEYNSTESKYEKSLKISL
jgi:hypothetical protein